MYTLYVHKCKCNNKLYIGITGRNPITRWSSGTGYVGSSYFYHAIQKYGWDNFQHIILLEGLTKEVACECEKYLIAKYKTNNHKYGYNITTGGENFNHSKETIQKIKDSNKGKIRSLETRQHISEAHKGLVSNFKGKHLSDDAKRKIGDANRGRIPSEETRKKISEANKGKIPSNKGTPCPENVKLAISITNKQVQHTDEWNKKVGDALRGRKLSDEHRKKLSESHKGYKHTEEQKRKIGAKSKEYWAKQRAKS